MVNKRVQTTLEKIARLYDLVAEMRDVIKELNEVEVDVKISRTQNFADPLADTAGVMIVLRPGCDLIRGG